MFSQFQYLYGSYIEKWDTNFYEMANTYCSIFLFPDVTNGYYIRTSLCRLWNNFFYFWFLSPSFFNFTELLLIRAWISRSFFLPQIHDSNPLAIKLFYNSSQIWAYIWFFNVPSNSPGIIPYAVSVTNNYLWMEWKNSLSYSYRFKLTVTWGFYLSGKFLCGFENSWFSKMAVKKSE